MKIILLIISIVALIDFCFAVSYNQPEFSPCASWNTNAMTFATDTTVGDTPYGIFVDTNNTVYVADRRNNLVLVWYEGDVVPARNISGDLSQPLSVFAATNGDIYVDNGSGVNKWTLNATSSETVMDVSNNCYGLFVDLNNTLYCCVEGDNQVFKNSLNSNETSPSVAAGNGINGSGSYMLNRPRGIFVDKDFNLYVADKGNDRIQRFSFGQLNGTTIVARAATGTITLHAPTDVVLDADNYLFIVDSNYGRIIGSGPNGYRCLVGCYDTSGSSSIDLNSPQMLSFDSYGNIFVTDRDNNRIQKFVLATNYCVSTQSTEQIGGVAVTTTAMVMEQTINIESIFPPAMITTEQTSIVSIQSTQHVDTTKQTSIVSIQSTQSDNTTEQTSIVSTHSTQHVDTTKQTSIDSTLSSTTKTTDETTTHQITTVFNRSTQHADTTQIKTTMISENMKTTTTETDSTTHSITNPPSSPNFIPRTCADPYSIGITCNVSSTPCDVFQPCQNEGSCINNKSIPIGYFCQCPSGFNGSECQFDIRPCKPNTCWNNGTCLNTSNTDFLCICAEGWIGIHCETQVNYCQNVTCQNSGVCRPLFQNYKCQCLLDTYSGRHCEIKANTLVAIQRVTRSFASIAIILIVSVFVLVGALDVLKYVFRINPTGNYRGRLKHKKARQKKQKSQVAIRFLYVNNTNETTI